MKCIDLLRALLLGSLPLASVVTAQVAVTQPSDVRLYRMLERDEQRQVDEWVKVKMPNLARLISNQPDSGRPFKRGRLLNAATTRWRSYQQAKDSSSTLEPVMRSVRLEDEIFGYILQFEDASADRRVALREKIRSQTAVLVELFFADRAERIRRLRVRLDAEQRSLDADRSQINSIVEQRLAHFMVEPTSRPSGDDAATTAPAP